MTKICIIGGGIIGCTTAWRLHREGHDILMLEAARAGEAASHTNAMQLCYTTIAPYARLADIGRYGKYLLKSDKNTPVYVRHPWNLQTVDFYLRSARTALPPFFETARRRLFDLAAVSRGVLADFMTEHPDIDFSYKQAGKMRLVATAEAFAREEKFTAHINKTHGAAIEMLGRDALLAREPALKAYQGHLYGASFSPADASGDSNALCHGVIKKLQEKGRFRLVEHANVTGFKKSGRDISGIITKDGDFDADEIVIAAGAGSAYLLKKIGISIPMMPVTGYSLTLESDPLGMTACASDLAHKFAINSYTGGLRLSGLMDFSGPLRGIDADRAGHLKATISKVLPQLDLDHAVVRAGMRPVMGGSYPLIGQTQYPNVWVNTGHGVYGWTLAFGSAARLADRLAEYL